ncbi:tetratricopeptide repeat-containing sensor histidine kinase [Flagellimonas myxillae]|uniref:tetratricopeptide repeat-containing sensor histidine kinase n=1 Tax=Flagellimonas myxillae TaxID=2942214 RepID=UPI00201EF001|nr:ATP-binding protein [Muricauda myxillae]MCL6267782.1 hypothetical protein [Muricauda myxillae]
MKHSLLLLLIVVSISCCTKKGDDLKAEKVNDSISHYFLESQDLKLKLDERLRAINKALEISRKVRDQEIMGQLAYQKSWIHYSSRQYDSLIFFDEYLFQDSIEGLDSYYIAKQRYLMGYYFSEIVHNSDKAFQNYTLSKGYYEQVGDSSWVGRNLLNMGTIQKDFNDFFGSKETLTEAIEFLTPKKDTTYIAQCYNLLATNHRKLLNYSDAIRNYNRAINMTGIEIDGLIYRNNLAVTYIDNAQYEDAIAILRSIIQDSLLKQNQREYARALDNLAYAKWLSEKNKKPKIFFEPLKIRKRINDNRGLIASYTHLGEFYIKTYPRRATSYFDSVIQLSRTLKIPRAEKDALKFLMELQPQNINLRDRYVHLQDSLYTQELKVKTQFAKYKYDDRLKQESILRLEKENAEKELEASQQRNQKTLYLGGLLFITSVLGLSLYGFRQRTYRLKQESKAEKLVAIQETEEQLSRKLHDDHGGKINQAMLMLQRGEDKSAILDKLESVYNQIRSFSREINTVDTGSDFWNSLKVTLEYLKPVEVEMIFDGGKELDWPLVSHQTKTIIFKVLQELVKNMAQHSKADQTVILFRVKKKELSIYYEDDGVGASKKSLLRKNGLWNTEKRIQALGGSITFDSEEEKGFRAEIRIPK